MTSSKYALDCAFRKDATNNALEKRLWEAADQLRANSGLTAAQYSQPVLGLIFLRFAEARFEKVRKLLEEKTPAPLRATRLADPNAYQAEGILFLAPEARYQWLLTLPEGAALGRELNEAMRAIERDNPQLSGVLSKTYEIFDSRTLIELLKLISSIPTSGEGDTFGRVYEYFLGTFAMAEGQLGGEFYTPTSPRPVPPGWEVLSLGELANLSWGDTSTTQESYVEDGFDAYSASGKDGKLDHFDFERTGIVLSAIGAKCGRTWLARGQWSRIKNTIRFWATTKRVSTEYLFLATADPGLWPKRGAAQPFISQGDAKRVPILGSRNRASMCARPLRITLNRINQIFRSFSGRTQR
jgi:hypothetical protein